MEANEVTLTWTNFKKVVQDKYLPRTYKIRKEQEFLELKQGSMAVADITKKVEELSLYFSHTRYANDEDWKINQYKYSLYGDIKHSVAQ